MIFQIGRKLEQNLHYFCNEIGCQELWKIAQFGHTVYSQKSFALMIPRTWSWSVQPESGSSSEEILPEQTLPSDLPTSASGIRCRNRKLCFWLTRRSSARCFHLRRGFWPSATRSSCFRFCFGALTHIRTQITLQNWLQNFSTNWPLPFRETTTPCCPPFSLPNRFWQNFLPPFCSSPTSIPVWTKRSRSSTSWSDPEPRDPSWRSWRASPTDFSATPACQSTATRASTKPPTN